MAYKGKILAMLKGDMTQVDDNIVDLNVSKIKQNNTIKNG